MPWSTSLRLTLPPSWNRKIVKRGEDIPHLESLLG
jgi:hypothetical protein